MLAQMWQIFSGVLLPVLVIVAAGAVFRRRYPLHIESLAKLNIYLFTPCLLFDKLAASTMPWGQIGQIFLAAFGTIALLGIPLFVILRQTRTEPASRAAMLVGGLFYNAGNFGFPVAALAFGVPGKQVQALIIVTANLSVWMLGYIIVALAQGRGLRGAMGYLKLPMIYVLAAAFIVRDAGIPVPDWIDVPVGSIADGAIPVMLIILGAQLAARARWPQWKRIGPVMAIKLLIMPAVGGLVVWTMGLWPWPGAGIVLALAAPTAVNTLVITLELEGDADLAAQCVFWTTVTSAVTVTLVLAVLTALGGSPP